jgi:putative nucleotidyltransferase with HDIG domain
VFYLRDPDVSDQRVLGLLNQDVALSSTVLAVANSPFYGLPRRVESLHQALRVLGFDALRNLIYAATVQRMFKQGRICEGFDAKCLWYHATTTGAGARRLALHLRGVDPQRAFLAGLLHDVGHIVEIQLDRAAYCATLEMAARAEGAGGAGFLAAEREHFGADHTELGASALETWKFPDWAVAVVAGHHQAQASPPRDDQGMLLAICQLADALSATLAGSFDLDLGGHSVAEQAASLGLEMSVVNEVREQVELECPKF